MPILRERLGEDGLEELEAMILERIKLHRVSRDGFREVLLRLEIVERNVNDLKMDVKELRKEMNDRFDRINERIDTMYERMTSLIKWTVGTLALFGTIISILLAVGQFIK